MNKRPVYCLLFLLFGSATIASAQKSSTKFEQQKNAVITAPALTAHPRLFFSKGEEREVLQKAKSNPLLSQLMEVLKKEAEKELQSVPQEYKPNVQLLAVSREQIKRLVTLSMAYRLFGDARYAKKAEEELLNVCKFPSWNPKHFLDVAEMTTAVAIGYDWCYDYLSPATRTAAENAIRDNGFKPAWPIYESTEKTPFNRENNWNMVCNSGMLNGAIAIGDKYPEELNRILTYAVKYTPHLLESFAPEGVFNEGPSYWGYNGMYMSLFFDNLHRNIHKDFGLPKYKGLDNTANYYAGIIGPTNKNFSFGDGSENVDRSGTFFLLSKLYKRPEVAAFYRNQISIAINEYNSKGAFEFPRFFFLAIPWFDDAGATAKMKEEKLSSFNGVTDFLVFNGSSSNDPNRLWLAAKTGRPSWSHNQLDVGSFIVDSDGERWGIDMGSDNYSLPDFWDYKPGGVRWNYFRNTNLSHNTISIDDKIANSNGQGELVACNKTAVQPFGIFDMSTAYAGEANSARRGFKLLSPDLILVRDEVSLKPGSKKLAWRFLTHAEVKINGNTATLTQNNKNFYIKCLLSAGYTMASFPAKTNTPDEKPIKNVTIIEISLEPKERLAVIPVVIGKSIPDAKATVAANLSLQKWK